MLSFDVIIFTVSKCYYFYDIIYCYHLLFFLKMLHTLAFLLLLQLFIKAKGRSYILKGIYMYKI
jgi:hypothetical protein